MKGSTANKKRDSSWRLNLLRVEKLLLTELYSQSNYIKIIALNQIILVLSRSFTKHLRTKGTEGQTSTRGNQLNMSRYQTRKGQMFEAELRRYMIAARIGSKEALRARTTVGSNVTMLKYFDDPETIPLGKLTEIMSALKIPKDERARIVAKLLET